MNHTIPSRRTGVHAALLASGLLAAAAAQAQADLILTNGKIATMVREGEFVQAVAVKDGKVLATGSNAAVLKHKTATTRVIDTGGRTVIPGLNDSHTHVIREGLNYNMELRWDGVTSLKRALDMLKEQAARTPEGEWVKVVGGWNEYQFEEKRLPTLEEINAAVPDRPVFVLYLYGLGFLNRKGIETLGYTSETKYKDGVVELDANGKPTGRLIAKPNALILYSTLAKTNKLSREDQVNSTLHYYRELNRLGVTSVIDAGGGFQNYPDDYGVTIGLAREGKLTVRTAYYLFAQTSWQGTGRLPALDRHDPPEEERPHVLSEWLLGGGCAARTWSPARPTSKTSWNHVPTCRPTWRTSWSRWSACWCRSAGRSGCTPPTAKASTATWR